MTMSRTLLLGLVMLLSAFGLSCPPAAQAETRSALWITAYYPWWSYYQMPISEIDFSTMTHIVVFSANPVKTPPYLDVLVNPRDSANVVNGVNTGQPSDYLRQLVRAAHAHGVKVVLSVGGIWGEGAENMRFIAQDDRRIAVFVEASCAFAQRWDLDGIELDWEFPQFADKWRHNRLILRFRQELDRWKPRGLFIAAVHESPLPAYDMKPMLEAFDQINPMTYELYRGDYSKNLTGYNSPIYRSSRFEPYIGTWIDQPGHGPRAWIDEGYPASKIGLSISFTTTVFSNVVPPVEPSRPYGSHNWGNIRDIPRRGRHWDHTSKVPWFGDGTTFITYEDTASSRLKVEYARSLGLGGVMVYELSGGYLPSAPREKRNAIMQSVAEAVRSPFAPLGDITPTGADRTKPKVTLLFPKDRAVVSGSIPLKADAKDDRAIVGLRFTIDGVPYGPVFDDAPASTPPLNTWRLTNGTHTIRAEAWDEANNWGSAQVVVTVKNQGPAPSFADLVIYDDALEPPFIDASWGVRNDFASEACVRSGRRALRVDYAPHGALWLQSGGWGAEKPLNPTDYTELMFDAYPSESFELEVTFSNNASQRVALQAGQWNQVKIPVGGEEAFTRFFLRRDAAGSATVYYDNIRLRAAQPFARQTVR